MRHSHRNEIDLHRLVNGKSSDNSPTKTIENKRSRLTFVEISRNQDSSRALPGTKIAKNAVIPNSEARCREAPRMLQIPSMRGKIGDVSCLCSNYQSSHLIASGLFNDKDRIFLDLLSDRPQ